MSRFTKSEAICSAVLTPGAITQRVATVDKSSASARDMMLVADRHLEFDRRRRTRKNAARDLDRGWCCIGISVSPDVLADIDEAVERLKDAGRRDMTRSKLLRIAFRELDLAAVSRERSE